MAIKDLNTLLKNMSPKLNEGTFVFCKVQNLSQVNIDQILATFKEKEGTTVVCNKSYADHKQLPYEFEAAWITLEVHSDLSAVGLTAAFSRVLANEGISCNVIAGYHHDHIFVPYEYADQAMELLKAM